MFNKLLKNKSSVKNVDFHNALYEEVSNSVGTAGFFCPRCFRPIIVDLDIKSKLISRLNDVHVQINYDINCPHCYNEFVWKGSPLDSNLTEAIATLNRKGYKTLFSCEGHNKKDIPYIYFRYPNQRKVLKYIPIGYPWKLRVCEDETSIVYPYEIKVLHKHSKQFCLEAEPNTDRTKLIKELYKWVNKLPECHSSIFLKRYIKLPLHSVIINEKESN